MAMGAFLTLDNCTARGGVADPNAASKLSHSVILNKTGTGNIDHVPSMFRRQISKETRS
jgi:hypothetical protein